ncbi:PAS domain-containing sensor histidine kinase [Cesiribacter sp. SM1]|uniref:PAS domain-containing sensor histidine kinase n=1 Tax=Cesiribacter sp. SM1 TaxID=2861196 RepID=UPI001CD42398|nr:PAS domain-containing sensor histidine kinase [Cesiribacter sp. SM1]
MEASNPDRERQLELEIQKLKKEISSCKALVEKNKVLEEKHTQSQIRFKTIFEQSQLGNKILGPDLKILEVNDAFIALLGYADKNALINRRVIEFAHPDFVQHWHALQVKLWEEKIPSFSLDTCLVRKDKSIVWCHVTSILFEDDERTLGYTILEDITERKILENRAKRLYEAQELVMNTVAHDLKSPLNTIQLLSGIIRSNIEAQEADKALLHLSLLDKTCRRNEVIINDLLLIGELELEDGSLQKSTVNVVEIANTIVEQLGAAAQKKNLVLVQRSPEPVVFAHVDREKLSRVVENLVSNAIKFTKSAGQVIVSVKEEEEHMLLQVEDQGIGIPESIQASIFNKFTKAKRKGTQGEQTTGLGLFIAKRIIDMHEGKIWFVSTENSGTTFCVRIPLY